MAASTLISLTDEQHAYALALVEAGCYADLSEVLQKGVELLREQMQAEESVTGDLSELLSRRREGRFVGVGEMDKRLDVMIGEKRRAHGVE